MKATILETTLAETDTLKFVSRGKVRDLYEVRDGADEYLLFVATDRISAFDVVLKNGVPGKGALLTQISTFWFARLSAILPNHVIAATLEDMPPGVRSQVAPHWDSLLKGRTLLVRKTRVIQLEAIVRGYLTGSAWTEYQESRTVHGIPLPAGLVESSRFPEPLFTPSTKAAPGAHDENVSPEQARALIGPELYTAVEHASLALYSAASAYAQSRGLILADTKFEFGLVPLSSLPSSEVPATSVIAIPDERTGATSSFALMLVDEALTPDSSRYWSAAAYTPGRPQASFDKQFLRDWLSRSGFRKGLENGPEGQEGEGWEMSEEVVKGTQERYEEVLQMLVD